ncbi:MAG: L-lactate permease [Myxococcales bacterium]|nr:L-lactate permease [Myxococcales bacterium]
MLLTVLAAIPIAAALLLLVVLRWPATRAMPVCAGVTALVAIFVWQMPVQRAAAAAVEGLWVTFTILLIVYGALFLLAFLRATGAMDVLQDCFRTLSSDARIQAILVAWILGAFLEGAAGFGDTRGDHRPAPRWARIYASPSRRRGAHR